MVGTHSVAPAHTGRPTTGQARAAVDRFLRRDEAHVILVVGNIALVAFEVIEWPVAALTLAVHLLAWSCYKSLEALAEESD